MWGCEGVREIHSEEDINMWQSCDSHVIITSSTSSEKVQNEEARSW